MTLAQEMSQRGLLEERLLHDLERLRKFLIQLFRHKMALAGLVIIVFFVIMSIAAPLIAGPYPTPDEATFPLQAPSAAHPLGTDAFGFDVFTLLMYGGRVSLLIAFIASGVAMVVGTGVGLAAGYYGRIADQVLSRATDFFLVIPWLPFVIVLVTILGSSLWTIIAAVAVVSWPTTARVIRAQVLTLKERRYVERARAIGADDFHILWKHILPNVMPLVWAEAVLTISGAVFTEAFLAFFGLGWKGPGSTASWGTMVNDAFTSLASFSGLWWYFLPPGIFITIVVLGFAMLGYGLEDIMNPALRRR
jgi:peptide/nickel transport system permease protein